MTCFDRNNLMMWVDGELPAEEAESISRHIINCAGCTAFIEAQKRMESLWREEWTDPPESVFENMRRGITQSTPWWRTQRTWYIAAVLCAAYLGVRVFYLDNAHTPLAAVAVSEIAAGANADEQSDQEATADVTMEQTDAVQPEEVAPVEESSVEIVLLTSDDSPGSSESAEDIQTEGIVSGCLGGSALPVMQDAVHQRDEAGRLMNSGYFEMSQEIVEVSAAESEISSESYGSDDSDQMAFGSISAVGAGSGGGGLSAAGNTSSTVQGQQSTTPSPEEDAVCCARSLDASVSTDYSVLITMGPSAAALIQRNDWMSLFEVIDKLLAQNYYCSGEEVVLCVDFSGNVSGPPELVETVIDVPQASYGNSTVTVYFY